jgi:site-specific recombinase XerD
MSALVPRNGVSPISLGISLLPQRNRTLAEYAPIFLQHLEFVRQRRANTVLGYGADLKTFLRFCEQADLSQPDEVTFRHLEFYLGWLQKERGLKATSANRHRHALRTFWQWMVREEITMKNPATDVFLLPTHKKLPDYLSIPEQEQLLAALAQDPIPLGCRDYALVATGLFTGLRCSELSHLQLGHLNLDAGILRVVDGKGRKDRELPIISRLERILRPYLEGTRPELLALSAGYIAAPRPQNGERSWAIVQTFPNGTRKRVARAPSREEAERLRAARPSSLSTNPYVFVRGSAQWLPKHGVAPLGPRTIFMTIRRLCQAVLNRKVHPHMLRHSFASRLRENGADLQDIQEALGHAVITTTTMYAHLTTRRQREKLAEYLK